MARTAHPTAPETPADPAVTDLPLRAFRVSFWGPDQLSEIIQAHSIHLTDGALIFVLLPATGGVLYRRVLGPGHWKDVAEEVVSPEAEGVH